MNTVAIERETNNYWALLKNISKEVKVALIARLSASLISENFANHKVDASQFAGLWSDEDYLDSDEIVQAIKDSRSFNHNIEAL